MKRLGAMLGDQVMSLIFQSFQTFQALANKQAFF
jgi:hypothetical protein